MQIDLQNTVIILVLCFATLQNKLATAVMACTFGWKLSFVDTPPTS